MVHTFYYDPHRTHSANERNEQTLLVAQVFNKKTFISYTAVKSTNLAQNTQENKCKIGTLYACKILRSKSRG